MKNEQLLCDDCGAEITQSFLSVARVDLCKECVFKRVELSLSTLDIGKRCDRCKGSGKEKEFYGLPGDYFWVDCKKCKGSGWLKPH